MQLGRAGGSNTSQESAMMMMMMKTFISLELLLLLLPSIQGQIFGHSSVQALSLDVTTPRDSYASRQSLSTVGICCDAFDILSAIIAIAVCIHKFIHSKSFNIPSKEI